MKLLKLKNVGNSKKRKAVKTKRETSFSDFYKIKFPREVKFLNKLNKANEKEYKEWLRRKTILNKLLGKSTLIIGAKGKNGIVLGGDRKVMRGGETDFEDKVRILKVKAAPIIFAAAGLLGVIEDFLEIFEKTLIANIKEGKIISLLSVKIMAEDLVETIERRYGPKFGMTSIFKFILGGLSELTKGEARLYEIGSPGYGEKIKYYSLIGHGRDYSRTIGKYLFPIPSSCENSSLSCSEIIPRISACINWISGDIDDYVGGDPQILYILDNKPEVKEGKYNKAKISKKVEQLKQMIKEVSFWVKYYIGVKHLY